jgi:hypothetical protein
MKSSRIALYAGGVIAVLAAALIVGLALGERPSQVASSTRPTAAATTSTPVPATTAPASPTPTATASPSLTPTAQTGAISGRLSYPSDFIPPVTVYAIDPDDRRIWFSVAFPGYGNPPRPTAQPGTEPGTYTLTGVAPGRYFVVAFRDDGQKPDPGLYTREAECLRRTPSGPCPDQSTIFITVTAGQTTREIDIVSWWPGSGLMPPPPPRPPIGYGLPRECRYELGATAPQTWLLTCPQGLTSNYLAPSLAQQGWTSCASSPKSWRKDQLAIVITDFVNRSDATGQMEQKPLSAISC